MAGNFLRIGAAISNFNADRRGTVGILFGLIAIPLLILIGVAIDYGRAMNAHESLQIAGDMAAIAAAAMRDGTQAQQTDRAIAIFKANTADKNIGNVESGIAIDGGKFTFSATADLSTPFMAIMGLKALTIATRSEAIAKNDGGMACMLALNASASDAIHVQGTNNVTAPDCWAWANSISGQAITGTGSARAVAAGFCTMGGAMERANYQPTPRTHCANLSDPYASLAAPPVGTCSFNNKTLSNGTYTLNPGVFCGGLDVQAQAIATFKPGVYIIKDGPLNFQAGSTGYGNGVVFYFTGSASTLQLRGGANVDLTAPSDGALGGFLFVQDRAASVGATTQIQGGGHVKISGVLYMPTQVVNIAGNGDLNLESKMFAMVADRFTLQGNGTLSLKVDYQGAGLPNVLPSTPGSVRLIN